MKVSNRKVLNDLCDIIAAAKLYMHDGLLEIVCLVGMAEVLRNSSAYMHQIGKWSPVRYYLLYRTALYLIYLGLAEFSRRGDEM